MSLIFILMIFEKLLLKFITVVLISNLTSNQPREIAQGLRQSNISHGQEPATSNLSFLVYSIYSQFTPFYPENVILGCFKNFDAVITVTIIANGPPV